MNNGRWYAAGVVSYAIGCGQQAFPTVFTKASAYLDWIQTIIARSKSA
jgi:secreted trypsin-like serine protease